MHARVPHASGASGAACQQCSIYRSANLKKLGVDMQQWDHVIALAGNPNTGKSTVFNKLTGLRQHTGNWPGKTVTRAEGGFAYQDKKYKLVDLPGTYSLLSTTLDEEIARDFILFGQPDVTVIVIDATSIERNLHLALQVHEITDRVMLCLNLMDEARRKGIHIDERQLSRDLGVPVVPTSARSGQGLPELLQTIHDIAEGRIVPKPHRLQNEPPALKQALARLTEAVLEAVPGLPNARWVAMRLLDGDEHIAHALRTGTLGSLSYEAKSMPGSLQHGAEMA